MFIVLSLFLAYLFLLGCAAGVFSSRRGDPLERLALAIAVGMLINYTLALTGLHLEVALAVGAAIAACGLVRLVRAVGAVPTTRVPRFGTIVLTCVVAYIVLLYYFQILAEPLLRWDARSIWFFHAKMVWTKGAFRETTGWSDPSVAFSSPDYPHLVPVLGAQLALIKGHWNEFVPKGSLFVMLVPLVLWVFSFRRRGVSFPLLVLLFFFSLHAWLWNGYMDAYMTLYGAAALLMFGRYVDERRAIDLLAALSALGIVANTKNEGLLFVLCAAAAVLLVGVSVPQSGPRELVGRFREDRLLRVLLAIAVMPSTLWIVLKKHWGLTNNVVGATGTVQRLSERLSDGVTPLYLLQYLTTRATVAWVLLLVIVSAALFTRYHRIRLHPGAAVAFAAAVLYSSGMYIIYLVTPFNVTWHLTTSATRVMATVSFSLLISIFFLLSALEAREAADAKGTADLEAVPNASPSAR